MSFSNSTDFYMWTSHWCDRCKNDNEAKGIDCPIILSIMLDEEPEEIVFGSNHPHDTICTEFEEDNEG